MTTLSLPLSSTNSILGSQTERTPNCSVCLEPVEKINILGLNQIAKPYKGNLKKYGPITATYCGEYHHFFHSACLQPWLQQQKLNCPNCRTDIQKITINNGTKFTTLDLRPAQSRRLPLVDGDENYESDNGFVNFLNGSTNSRCIIL